MFVPLANEFMQASVRTTFGGDYLRTNLGTDKDVQLWTETGQYSFRQLHIKHILQYY